MNKLVKNYAVDTQFPDVSGIEHLQMLQNRSELAKIETTLTVEERRTLAQADQRLLTHAFEFWKELSRFISLVEEREQHQPPPEQWWWYLDVLAQLPKPSPQETILTVTA